MPTDPTTAPPAELPTVARLISDWAWPAEVIPGVDLLLAEIGPEDDPDEIVAAGHVDIERMDAAVTALARYADWPDLIPVPAVTWEWAVVVPAADPDPDRDPDDPGLVIARAQESDPGAQPLTVVRRSGPLATAVTPDQDDFPADDQDDFPADGQPFRRDGRVTLLVNRENKTGARWAHGTLVLADERCLPFKVFPQTYAAFSGVLSKNADVTIAGRIDRRAGFADLIVTDVAARPVPMPPLRRLQGTWLRGWDAVLTVTKNLWGITRAALDPVARLLGVRALERLYWTRRARQTSELATAARQAGMPGQAAKLEELAARESGRAGR